MAMQTTTTTTVGLCLLPSDLLHDIFFRLPLPYLHRLRSVSTSLTSLLTSRDFRRLLHPRLLSDSTWLFLLTKRPPSRSSLLRGFHRRSLRWFTFPHHLPPALDDDLYFLSASGNFFLFTSNSLLRLVAVDLAAATARALPLCPLGPRGTSSWRRSGFKLLSSPSSSSSSFRFLFADLHRGRPALFEYSSATDGWRSVLAEPSGGGQQVTRGGGGRTIFLNVSDFVLAVAGVNEEEEEAVPPVVYYYTPRMLEGLGAVGRLHVYGDGMAAVVSTVATGGGRRSVTSVELWGPARGGQEWEMVTRVPEGLLGSGDYGVMKGCLEERDGVVWLVLVSNLRGDWSIVWLGYHRRREEWECVPVADPGAKGFNMAGIAVGTSFLGRWPSSSSSSSSSATI